MTIRVGIVEVAEILDLRHRILRAGLPVETAHLPGDHVPDTRHLALWCGDCLMACVSLMVAPYDDQPAVQLRGMAVEAETRGRGVGRRLLAAAEDLVRADGFALIWCNARETARGFYDKHGWRVVSEPFFIEHAGRHFRMLKSLISTTATDPTGS